MLIPLASCLAVGEGVRIIDGPREVWIETTTHSDHEWIDLEEMARKLDITSRWDPLPRRQSYIKQNYPPVVLLGGEKNVRLGGQHSLLPGLLQMEGDRLLAPLQWVSSELASFWGIELLKEAKPTPTPDIQSSIDTSNIPDTLEEAMRKAQPTPIPVIAEKSFKRIILDAGHGGTDGGSVSLSGAREADLTLLLCKSIAKRLRKARPSIEVVMTRNRDETIEEAARSGIVNRSEADALISIHCGARRIKSEGGIWIFYMSDLLDNKTAVSGWQQGYSTLPLWSFSYQPHQNKSRKLAEYMARQLGNTDANRVAVMPSRLRLLRGLMMPATLIEVGNLASEVDAGRLVRVRDREKLAKAIADAIMSFKPGDQTP
jgi:N-acetylmuramoyl-L-alanine amidase